jgi:hypothetical protein
VAKPGLLNANSLRAYPLVGDPPPTVTRVRSPDPEDPNLAVPWRLPDNLVVGFGAVVGPLAFWDPSAIMYLDSVEFTPDDTAILRVRSTATGLFNHALVFTRRRDDPEFATEYVAATLADGAPGGGGPCGPELVWEGFLTTGDIAGLFAPDYVETWTGSQEMTALEPATVQDLSRSRVTSLGLANADRVRATAPAGCPEPDEGTSASASASWAGGGGGLWVSRACLTGPIRLRPGYNCSIRQDPAANAITISAQDAAGAGRPCAEVPLFPGEAPDAGESLLSGGPACGELILSIDGAIGPEVRVPTFGGVRAEVDPDDPSLLRLDFDLGAMRACPPIPDDDGG